jgi:hypothetical protein
LWALIFTAVFSRHMFTIGLPSLTSFLIEGEVAAELATLVGLVGDGDLRVDVGWRGPLERFADAAEALRARRVNGKAMLDLNDPPDHADAANGQQCTIPESGHVPTLTQPCRRRSRKTRTLCWGEPQPLARAAWDGPQFGPGASRGAIRRLPGFCRAGGHASLTS